MSRLLLLAPLLATGCSFIYDVDDLRVVDAAAPDAIPVDGDATMLTIDHADPMAIDEGTGADGGRPVVIVLVGNNIIAPTLTVTLDPDGTPMTLEPLLLGRSANEARLSFALVIPVLEDLGAGQSRVLRVVVSQGGADDIEIDLTVNGLEEFAPTVATLGAATLDDRYSRITIDSALHFTGTTPVILRATGGVTISGPVDADAAGQTAGAGGCGGGAASAPGGCGASGGHAGGDQTVGSGDGGGGGGFADIGTQGVGDTGGAGGDATGNDMLVPFGASTNRGGGGGGGGAGLLGALGGAGGGGGGAIYVNAGGDLTVSAAISVAGDDGLIANGTGGGGGSGGSILLRTGGAFVGSGPGLDAPAGAGGVASPSSGGAGSVGRIRIDAAAGTIAASPTAVRGPSWDAATLLISESVDATLTLHGQPNRELGVFVNGVATEDFRVGAGGTVPVEVTLLAGHNQVCAAHTTIADAAVLADPALSCVDVVVR